MKLTAGQIFHFVPFLILALSLSVSASGSAAEAEAKTEKAVSENRTAPTAVFPEKASIRIADGSRTADGAIRALAVEYGLENRDLSIQIDQVSSAEALCRVASGGADLALHLKVEGEKHASSLSKDTPRLYARSATVFLVNVANPVNGLASEQLKNIYTGKIRDWKSITGLDYSLHLYAPDAALPGDGLVRKLIKPVLITPQIYRTRSASEIPLLVSLNTYSLGIMPYLPALKLPENVRMLKVDGVAPSPENIVSGKYPVAEEIFISYPAEISPETAKFISRMKRLDFRKLLNENYLFL